MAEVFWVVVDSRATSRKFARWKPAEVSLVFDCPCDTSDAADWGERLRLVFSNRWKMWIVGYYALMRREEQLEKFDVVWPSFECLKPALEKAASMSRDDNGLVIGVWDRNKTLLCIYLDGRAYTETKSELTGVNEQCGNAA